MTPSRCSPCPGPQFSYVPSDGPTPSLVLFIGAGPGERENRTRVPYSGQAGDEFNNTYLTAAGLRREDVHVDNAMKCWSGTKNTPKSATCMTCAATHLPRTLGQVKPEVVVLMGGAVQGLSDTRVRLDMQHGIPFWSGVMGGEWEGWVWPMYEPALGMRDTPRMTQLIEDFRHLGQWMRGEWTPPTAPEHKKDYALISDIDDLRRYLSLYQHDWTATDTETNGGKPWSVQFSLKPHTGRMILAENRPCLEMYQDWLEMWGAEMILHFAGQDLDTLARMGVVPKSFRDTGQEAYHMCSLPQGLKPLAFRLLGVTMKSWADTVLPASTNALLRWMADAMALSATGLEDIVTTEMKTWTCLACGHRAHRQKSKCGSKAGGIAACGCVDSTRVSNVKYERRPSVVANIFKHVSRYTIDTREDDDPYDPWKALAKMKVEGLRGKKAEAWEWQWLENELGPTPILSIANADLEEAVQYGCGDSDLTGQVAMELERLRGDKRWEIDEGDIDA